MALRVAVAFVFLCFACGASPSSAAGCYAGPSQADIDACTPDVHDKCGEFIPDQGAIARCLRQKVKLLSAACRTVMTRRAPQLPPCRTGNN